MDSETNTQVSQFVETDTISVALKHLKKVVPAMFAELTELRRLFKILGSRAGIEEFISNYYDLGEKLTITSNSLTKSYARNIELESNIAILKKDIDTLNSNNKELSSTLTLSRNRNAVLYSSNITLTKDNSNLISSNTELKLTNDNLIQSHSNEIIELKNINIEMSNELELIKSYNVELTKDNSNLINSNTELKLTNDNLIHSHASEIIELELTKSYNVELSNKIRCIDEQLIHVENENNSKCVNVLEFLVALFIIYVSYLLLQ